MVFGISVRTVTAIVVVYLATMAASLMWINPDVTFAIYWPPAGLLLGCMLLRPTREWPAILGLIFPFSVYLDMSAGRTLWVAAGFSITDVIGALGAAGALRRLFGERFPLENRRELFELVLWGASANAVGAFVGAGAARAAGATDPYATLWLGWFLSTISSVVIVTPVVLAGAQIRLGDLTVRRTVELAALVGAVVAVTWLIFHQPDAHNISLALLVYLPFPLLAAMALRFGVQGAATASMLLSIVAVWGTVLERGPLKLLAETPGFRVIWLLAYLSTISVSSLVLACLLGERTRAETTLRRRERQLRRHNRAFRNLSTTKHGRADIDQALHEITQVSSRALDVARVSVWLYDTNRTGITCRDLYDRSLDEHIRGQFLDASNCPDYFDALDAERIVAVDDACNDPRTRELAEKYLIPLGIVSMLDVQIRVFDNLVGVLCHEHIGDMRDWSQDEISFARSTANLVALALEAEERYRIETSLRESEKMFRTLAETAASSILILQDERFVYANSAAVNGLEYSREDLLALDPFTLVHVDDREAISAHIADRLRGVAASPRKEIRILTKSGDTLWIQVTPASIPYGGRAAILLTGFDVTELKQASDRIQRLNLDLEHRVVERTAQLQAANDKLKELDRLKSEFLATMSHELRTPLNSIIGFTGVLLMGLPGPLTAEQRKQLGMVGSSARLLLSLINDLLDLSRIESGQMELHRESFSVDDLVGQVFDSLTPQVAAKALDLRMVGDAGGVVLFSDRKRCFQILLNLVNNAVKFTEAGSVEVQCRQLDGKVLISVVDTGIGIKPENMQMLFEAFRQIDGSARRHYEGTGLGLYLCRKLLDLLGGEIWAESQFGTGSTFSFTLPLGPQAADADET